MIDLMVNLLEEIIEGRFKMNKIWQKQRLLFKLIFIVLISILTTLIVLYVLLSSQMSETTQENEEENLLMLARHLAQDERVIEATENERTNENLVNFANNFNDNFGLDYTVIMTDDSIRLTHPDTELIYRHFQGNDQHKAFEGLEYTSIGEGTLGRSLRSFVPIYNRNQEVVGAVSLGLTIGNLEQLMARNIQPLSLAFGISTLLGITLASLVAYSLKKQMLDMEPHEIARVSEERNAMMEHATDAVFVTNEKQDIILVNQEAKKRFHLNNDQTENQHITDALPFLFSEKDSGESVERGNTIYEYNTQEYIVSFAPIIVNEKLVGNIYILRDATELHMLTSQLYSTSEYAYTLEAQQHDFLNKLHVVYGLTDLEEYDELKIYLEDLIEPEQEFSKRVAYLVHNPAIAGFLIGERRKFSENQLALTIEIYPDIPATEDLSSTQSWIHSVDSINKFLLDDDQITEVHLKLAYFDEVINTTYQIRGNIKSLHGKLIASPYKKFIKEFGNNWITITFDLKYQKSEVNKFDQ